MSRKTNDRRRWHEKPWSVPEVFCELKIDVGPGYRVYYTERSGELIILLAGGDKSSQQKDIKTAIALARSL